MHDLVSGKYGILMQLIIKKESTRILFQNRLAKKIHRNGIEEENNVKQAWKKIRNNIVNRVGSDQHKDSEHEWQEK